MHPILFSLPFIEVHSYYVLWAFALLIFTLWTRQRAVNKYKISWQDATSVIIWIYCAAIAGSFIGNGIEKIPLYLTGKLTIDSILEGGMSSAFGMLCGGLAGFYRLKKLSLSIDDFAEASAIPAAAMISVGRNGCFFEGCCSGSGLMFAERPWWGVHFPEDPINIYRYPSQLSEACFALIITIVLYFIEKQAPKHGIKIGNSAILAPLFFILYGIYRLIFDNFRTVKPALAFYSGYYLFGVSVIIGILWILRTWNIRRKFSQQ